MRAPDPAPGSSEVVAGTILPVRSLAGDRAQPPPPVRESADRPNDLPSRAVRIRRLISEARIVDLLAFGLFVTVAYLLDFKYLIFLGDAMSRMANGYYVVFSRDPHLAAIGFVWPPLTSIVDLGFLLFKGVWPALATHEVAGSLTTVLAMTGAVHQLRAALREWNVPRLPRLILVALFALDPMIVYYAANGMSEAMYLFTLTAGTRYLLRWIRDETDVRSLVYSAAMVALAFLGRNEATAAALAGTLLVLGITFTRSKDTGRTRLMQSLTDGAVFALPFVVTFSGWAISGWVLTKQLLAQFSANALQVSLSGVARSSKGSRLVHEVHALSYMTPLLAVAILLALVVALRRRDPQALAIVAILGGSQAFSLYAYYSGSVFPWFRFYLPAVPIEILLVGYVLSRPGHGPVTDEAERVVADAARSRGPVAHRARRRPVLLSMGGAVVALAIVAPSLPVAGREMVNPNSSIAPEESAYLGFVFHHRLTSGDRAAKGHYAAILAVSRYIADMHLANGSVVTDNTAGCVPETIVTSPNPRVFVIPNDRDFQRVLNAPATFHAHYLLLPAPVGLDQYDAISRKYPGIFSGTQAWVTSAHLFPGRGLCPSLRLLRVLKDPVSY